MSRTKLRSSQKTSSSGKDRRRRWTLYAIPIIATLFVGGVFAIAYYHPGVRGCSDQPSSPATVNYSVGLQIQVENKAGSQARLIATPPVGTAGGYWNSHQYDSYGTDGRYPLCTDPPITSGTFSGYNKIYVRSNTIVNYTLRDFFNVWGQPLGYSDNDTTLNSAYLTPTYGYLWQMCIGNPHQTSGLRLGNWSYQPLYDQEYITLIYYPATSGVGGCIG